MGVFYSSDGHFTVPAFQSPSFPAFPYITFNSVMLTLSTGILGSNWAYCAQKFKDLPVQVPIKIFQKQKMDFLVSKRFLFGLPAIGTGGILWGILMAANTNIYPYPTEFNEENRREVDSLMSGFIYFGLLLSQISLSQNSIRMIYPDSIGTSWFKGCYLGLSLSSILGYAYVGYEFYQIVSKQNAASKKIETMFSHA